MDETDSRESRKIKAAYAAIVPFVLAEVVILVVEYGGVEIATRFFFGLLLVANIVIASLVFVLIGSWRRRR